MGPAREPADPRRGPLFITAAERLATCPWQTFVARVLRVEPLPDALGPLPTLDPRTLGVLVHEVLEQLVGEQLGAREEELGKAGGREPVDVVWPGRAALAAVLLECAERVARRESVALPGFGRVLAARAAQHLEAARAVDWPAPGARVPVLGVEVRGSCFLHTADGGREIHFRADRVDRIGQRLRLVDYKAGTPPRLPADAEKRAEVLRGRVARGQLLQAAAYARASVDAAAGVPEGRYLYLGPDVPAHARSVEARRQDEALAGELERALQTIVGAWDAGSFFPRLVDLEKDQEPGACRTCGVREACAQGDTGARSRLAAWGRSLEDGTRDAAALGPGESALWALWQLGEGKS